MKVKLEHVHDEARHIRTFFFRPEQPFSYTAGQYTELTVPHDNPDERGTKHWFTLSSSPTDELLSITTKYASQHPSTFKQTLWHLPIGAELHMTDAMGDFVLPKDKTIPLVFVAGGIGCTPFHSMIKWLKDNGDKRHIQMIYGARDPEEVAFRELFEDYTDQLQLIVSEPPAGWSGLTDKLSAAKILELSGNPADKLFFLSGPEQMVKDLADDLRTRGLDNHQVVVDDFPGYTEI